MESLNKIINEEQPSDDLFDDDGNLFQKAFRQSPKPYIDRLAENMGIAEPIS